MDRAILRLAIPNVLSNISVPLLSSFDTALMGRLGGDHILAVGLGAMAFNFVYWNFGFLRMATTGLVAQEFGREDLGAQRTIFWRAGLLALVLGLGIVVLRIPLLDGAAWLLNVRAEQMPLVTEYFLVRAWAAPAALLQLVVLAWFFGRQNATWPLGLTIAVNVANLEISWYLVADLGWGISGVAWGTVVAQYLGLSIGLGLLLSEGKLARPAADLLVAGALGRFFRINRDVFVRTICLTLSFAFFYNRSNALDLPTAVVAANVILLQLVNWLSYGIDGFAYAAESLVGAHAGAGGTDGARRVIRRIFVYGMGLAALYALVYGLGSAPLVSLFAPADAAPATLTATLEYLPAVVALCLIATPCYLFDGVFIGLVAARAMRQTMLIALAIYLASYVLVGYQFGNWGLWGCLLLFLGLRGSLQFLWWRRGWLS